MNKFKRYYLEKLHCGICSFSGCNRKHVSGKTKCAYHLKAERERARVNYRKKKEKSMSDPNEMQGPDVPSLPSRTGFYSGRSLGEEARVAAEKINQAVAEAAEKKASIMEAYVKTYLEVTGHKIEDLCIVEETRGPKMFWYLALKSKVGATVNGTDQSNPR